MCFLYLKFFEPRKNENNATSKKTQKHNKTQKSQEQSMTRRDVLKSYTKHPLYSHQNSLPPLIYIILINPTCTHEQCVKKEEEKKQSLK